MSEAVYIGVDVGTSSVRAYAVGASGQSRAHQTVKISIHNPKQDQYQQSSEEIWAAVCSAVKSVSGELDDDEVVSGVGFDATCSLVVLGEDWEPVTVDETSGDAKWDIIMWMDHRASKEAELINSKDYSVLQYLGGKVSLEMQTPKLLWLKKHLPQSWKRAKHFFDLPDFLTMKASGSRSRSLCSLLCKWTYVHDGSRQGWDSQFLSDIGLEDLTEDGYSKIGCQVLAPGSQCGAVTDEAALALGVPRGTPVAASMIDAHAGALALFADGEKHLSKKCFGSILAMICGTSTCHMLCSKERFEVAGVWGPYYSAILSGYWAAEAGQSATGALCDHVINSHPAGSKLPEKWKDRSHEYVAELIRKLASRKGLADPTELTKDFHVYPDYHGNRSPLADPNMKGMVCGLTLDCAEDDLAVQYLATVQALAYGSRCIIERLRGSGHAVSAVLLCGGLAQSRLFSQTHADVLGLEVLVPHDQTRSVVRGAAMLGAAAGCGGDLEAVMRKMAGDTRVTKPRAEYARFHDKKYEVYEKMQQNQIAYRKIMQ